MSAVAALLCGLGLALISASIVLGVGHLLYGRRRE